MVSYSIFISKKRNAKFIFYGNSIILQALIAIYFENESTFSGPAD